MVMAHSMSSMMIQGRTGIIREGNTLIFVLISFPLSDAFLCTRCFSNWWAD